jgi:hypothetical protein
LTSLRLLVLIMIVLIDQIEGWQARLLMTMLVGQRSIIDSSSGSSSSRSRLSGLTDHLPRE